MEVTMVLKSGFTTKTQANVVPNVTGTIERTPFRSETIKQVLKQYELADTIPAKIGNCNSDLLVGNNYYGDIVLTKSVIIWDGLYLVGSKFGWILSGSTENEYTARKRNSLTMLMYSSGEISTNFLGFSKIDHSMFSISHLDDFWALEIIGIKES